MVTCDLEYCILELYVHMGHSNNNTKLLFSIIEAVPKVLYSNKVLVDIQIIFILLKIIECL